MNSRGSNDWFSNFILWRKWQERFYTILVAFFFATWLLPGLGIFNTRPYEIPFLILYAIARLMHSAWASRTIWPNDEEGQNSHLYHLIQAIKDNWVLLVLIGLRYLYTYRGMSWALGAMIACLILDDILRRRHLKNLNESDDS